MDNDEKTARIAVIGFLCAITLFIIGAFIHGMRELDIKEKQGFYRAESQKRTKE